MPRAPAYKKAIGDKICAEISEGASLFAVCERLKLPRRTVRSWIERHPDFALSYECARRHQVDTFVDQMIGISDSVKGSDNMAAVQAARLQLHAREWIAARLMPNRYGDRVALTGADGADLIPQAEIDNGRIALAIISLLEAARPKAERPIVDVTAEPVEPEAPPALPPQAAHGAILQGVAAPLPRATDTFGDSRIVRLVPKIITGASHDIPEAPALQLFAVAAGR